VGGTNPSLLRAIGAGAAVIAYDVDFNREVTADAGRYFADAGDVARLLVDAEADPAAVALDGKRAAERARRYDWDEVAAGYEELAARLVARSFPAVRPSGRRHRGRPTSPAAVPAPRPTPAPEHLAGGLGALPLPGAQQ
jgi:hypothetical protein